ncbi:hypothetical protein OAA15_00720 [bacterium]|nr:hypothetical protein [bacterium]
MQTQNEKFKSGYAAISENSKSNKGETNDCVVRAVMNSFDIEYDKAHKWCATKLRRKHRQGVMNTIAKLADLANNDFTLNGKTIRKIYMGKKGEVEKEWNPSRWKKMEILRNPSYSHKHVDYTVGTFTEDFNKGTFLAIVRGHAICIKDGVLYDNREYQHSGNRRPLKAIFQIEEK